MDLRDYTGVVSIIYGTVEANTAGGNVTVSLLDSPDNNTFATFAGMPTMADLSTSQTMTVALDTRNCRRYLQSKIVTTAAVTHNTAVSVCGIKNIQ